MYLNKTDLRKLQISMYHILKEVDRICTLHDINYSLAYGTLLGAIRHEGFIPWDDDLDIIMLREDYEKFLEISNKELHKDFKLAHSGNHKDYFQVFSRVYLSKSTLVQECYQHLDMKQGIFIDVFPIDEITPDNKKLKKQTSRINFLGRLRNIKLNLFGRDLLKVKVLRKIMNVFLLPVSLQTIMKAINKQQQKYNGYNYEHVGYFKYGSYGLLSQRTWKKEDLQNVSRMKFEKSQFKVSSNWEKILSDTYGDFMKLPDVKDQKPSHEIKSLTFDENYTKFQ